MQVTFTKMDAARYSVAITRERGPALVARQAPGYDPYLPHELAHYLVEDEFDIRLGVFGQLAAGGEGVYTPAPNDRSGRSRRTAKRIAEIGRDDMSRSERLVGLCQSLWKARSGRASATPAVIDMALATPFDVDRTIKRFDEVSGRWSALHSGESITFEWPESHTFRSGTSSAGRQSRDRRGRRTHVAASR